MSARIQTSTFVLPPAVGASTSGRPATRPAGATPSREIAAGDLIEIAAPADGTMTER